MAPEELEARERLIRATVELLNESSDPDKITARRIAERAQVSLGSINYYFQSKDNLIYEAVLHLMGETAASWYEPFQHSDVQPAARLRQLLKETARVNLHFPKFAQIAIGHALLNDDFNVPALILPLLRDIFGGQKRELELRLIAFQLITPLQVVALRPEAFRRYAGVNIFDESQLDMVIDQMIDVLLNQQNES